MTDRTVGHRANCNQGPSVGSAPPETLSPPPVFWRPASGRLTSLLSTLTELNRGAFVGRVAPTRSVLRRSRDNFLGSQPGAEGVAMLEYIYNPAWAGDPNPQQNNASACQYFTSWLSTFPARKLVEMRVSVGQDNHLVPFSDASCLKMWGFLRFEDRDPGPDLIRPNRLRKVTPDEEKTFLQRMDCRPAAQGVVCPANGRGWAILEQVYTPVPTPDQWNADPYGCNLPIQQQNAEHVKLRHLWYHAYPSRMVVSTFSDLQIAQFNNPVDKVVRIVDLINFQEQPGVRSGIDVEAFNRRPMTEVDKLSARIREANVVAENGLVARNGFGYAFIEYIAPPPVVGELNLREQFTKFLVMLNEWDNKYPRRKLIGDAFRYQWAMNLIEPGLTPKEGRDTRASFNFGLLHRFVDEEAKRRFASDPDSYRSPVLRTPSTEFEHQAARWNMQNRINEEGVVNRFGEGWANIEMVSAPRLKGELSLQEQNEEWIKTLVQWHDRYPGREIVEAHFSMNEGEFMGSSTKSFLRRLIVRFVDHRFKRLSPEQQQRKIVTEALPASTEYQKLTNYLMAEHHAAGAWKGYEDEMGRGFAMIEMVGQPPMNDERHPRGQMYEFLKLLNKWSEEFPQRKIVLTSPHVAWGTHLVPMDASPGFIFRMLVNFERR